MSTKDRSRGSKGPLIWALGLAFVGLLLLLSNFFLLGDFNILHLSPVLLVILGAQVLLRGDIVPSSDFRTFGITRGSIESATLEINAGEIDIYIRNLERRNSERLIAGQYANQARPELEVRDVHARLKMERSKTPWLSFSNWEMGISQDLPWQLVLGSNFGQISADLSKIILQNALISTGIGDIQVTLPAEAFESLYLHSLVGNVTVICPPQYKARITIQAGRFFGVSVDESRYEMLEAGVYLSRDVDDDLPLVDVVISGTFGDCYLS